MTIFVGVVTLYYPYHARCHNSHNPSQIPVTNIQSNKNTNVYNIFSLNIIAIILSIGRECLRASTILRLTLVTDNQHQQLKDNYLLASTSRFSSGITFRSSSQVSTQDSIIGVRSTRYSTICKAGSVFLSYCNIIP